MTRASAPPVAYAGGLPLPQHVAEQASRWYVLLMSGAHTEEDRQACERWRQADPDHERAWAHLMRADGRLRDLAGSPAYQALTNGQRKGRRRALIAMLGLATGAGGLVWTADRMRWVRLSPDHVAGVGEQRTVVLADGTEVLLNTDSAIDVLYDERTRRLRLRRGEIQIRTGHGAGYAGLPFRVDTPAGGVRALGTRFMVRLDGDQARVALLKGSWRSSRRRAGAGCCCSRGRPRATAPAASSPSVRWHWPTSPGSMPNWRPMTCRWTVSWPN